MHRREWMVRSVPAFLFFIPFEHREVHYPQQFENCWVEKFVTIVVLLPGEQSQMAAGLIESLFGPLPLGRTRPSGDYQEIVLARARCLARLLNQLWIELFQIVIDSQAAFQARILQLLALAAAERASLGNVNGNRRKCQPKLPRLT